ncbi:hypothetical protein HJG60_007770 [Phyllostomus discolor]|uniref:Uncharacterized protein n=1 Tax=Phyllostomus discolor TaxID=89673 RepID=A0A834EY52_9CHIR|nr:hypothetical protein HJG60_007770 [Phyllostomus discolor]
MTPAPATVQPQLHERPARRTSQQGPNDPKLGEKMHRHFNPRRCISQHQMTRMPPLHLHLRSALVQATVSTPPARSLAPGPIPHAAHRASVTVTRACHHLASPCPFQPSQPPDHTLGRVLFCPNTLALFKTPLP